MSAWHCVQYSLRDEAEGATDRSRVCGGMNDALGYPSQGEAVMDTKLLMMQLFCLLISRTHHFEDLCPQS